jgi:hypothetical protein
VDECRTYVRQTYVRHKRERATSVLADAVGRVACAQLVQYVHAWVDPAPRPPGCRTPDVTRRRRPPSICICMQQRTTCPASACSSAASSSSSTRHLHPSHSTLRQYIVTEIGNKIYKIDASFNSETRHLQ